MQRYSEYTDRGIQWIGAIPSHWKLRKMKYLFSERSEKNHPDEPMLSATQTEGVILQSKYKNRVVAVNTGFEGLKLVKVGDFVIHLRSFQGGIEYTYDQGIISSAYTILTPKYFEYSDYFKLLLKSTPYINLLKVCVTGIREGQNINYAKLKQNFIPLPPLSEQQAIVSYLDDKCAKLDQLVANKEMELKLCRESIESLIYLESNTAPTSIASWENYFPDNWDTILGKALFEEVKLKGSDEERFLAVTQDNGLIFKDGGDVNFVTAENKKSQKIVNPGQFVISLRSFEGGIEYSDKRGLISQAYVVLKLREQFDTKDLRMYYRFLFKSQPFVQRLNTISDSMRDGKSIKFKDIKGFRFPIPSKERLQRILAFTNVYDRLKKSFDQEKKLLTEYKQRLISDVVTGQIKVC